VFTSTSRSKPSVVQALFDNGLSRFINEKETAMKNKHKHRLKLLVALVAALGIANVAQATNTPIDASITVTPIADVSLAISPTYYAFGNVSVNTSSHSATALSLSNNGQVNVTVDKRITTESNPAGWTAGTAAAADTYVLYAATSTVRPATGDFVAGTSRLGILNNVSNLQGVGGGTPTITTSGGALPSVNLWFKIDMPTSVTAQTARQITVRFTGTAQ